MAANRAPWYSDLSLSTEQASEAAEAAAEHRTANTHLTRASSGVENSIGNGVFKPPRGAEITLARAAAAEATSAARGSALAAQRLAISARSVPGRAQIYLDANKTGVEVWDVPCGTNFWSDLSARNTSETALAVRCSRLLWRSFARLPQAMMLREAIEGSLGGLLHQGVEVSLVPDAAARDRLGPGAFRLLGALAEHARVVATQHFVPPGGESLCLVGALMKRLRLPAEDGPNQVEPKHDPYVPHSDQVNVAGYEYSALLYLSTAGDDFDGGDFVFLDEDKDRAVRLNAGDLVAFTSGLENLHRAAPMTWGARYVVGFWFGREGAGLGRECLSTLTGDISGSGGSFAAAGGGRSGVGSTGAVDDTLEAVAPAVAILALVFLVAEVLRSLRRLLTPSRGQPPPLLLETQPTSPSSAQRGGMHHDNEFGSSVSTSSLQLRHREVNQRSCESGAASENIVRGLLGR
eukprot:TRINITY_DN73698_c0_g1_i1.p1 TRINITY_DN73698_c0_g1~~TRINITY_DN73698_c0_g1_i1.p1  ORF type:complete len:463 (-),score=81.05 TRINITY_DN73698_c0_g1_i1:8-1396(-)